MKAQDKEGLRAKLEELWEPKAFAATGGVVGLVLWVLYTLTLGPGHEYLWNAPFAVAFGAAIFSLILYGHQANREDIKWMIAGGVVGLVLGALTINFWLLFIATAIVSTLLGLYRGYGQAQVVKHDSSRHFNLMATAGLSMNLLTVCTGLAMGLRIDNLLLGLVYAVMLFAGWLVTLLTAAKIVEERLISNVEQARYDHQIEKRNRKSSHPPAM